MRKADKETKIIERINYLSELDNVGFNDYYYIDLLEDIIAEVVFGCKHNKQGNVIIPNERYILEGILRVIRNMENKGVIKVSKSRKMFKLA